MKLQSACLCDSAHDYHGKLCILGAFDTIVARELPAAHPACALALRFVSDADDAGRHQINVALVDSEGSSLLPAGAIKVDFSLEPLPNGHFFATHNCIISLQGVVLPATGPYALDIYMDGEKIGSTPLQVVPQS